MRNSLVLFAVLLAGCFGDGDGSQTVAPAAEGPPPVISDLVLTPETVVYMEGEGSVTATAKVAFVDLDMDIESMQLEMPDGSSETIMLEAVDTESGTLSEHFALSTADIGPCRIEVWLVDAAGHASNHLRGKITVQSPEPEDVSTWLERVSALPNILNDVTWAGSQFLAVGDGGMILYSPDGITWTTVESGTTVDLNAIAFGGAQYIVVGDEGTVLYSTGGEDWSPTPGQGPEDVSLRAAVYFGRQLVAGGKKANSADTAFIMTSMDDGQSWTVADYVPQSGRSITDLAAGDSQIVATTQTDETRDKEAHIFTSADGMNWVEVVITADTLALYSALHTGAEFVVAGTNDMVYASPDGINWSGWQTVPRCVTYLAVAWSGSTFITDGQNDCFGWGPIDFSGGATADRGQSWTSFGVATEYDSHGLAWGNGRFVSVGCAGPEGDCWHDVGEGAIYSTP